MFYNDVANLKFSNLNVNVEDLPDVEFISPMLKNGQKYL